jgi:hypothetical protein
MAIAASSAVSTASHSFDSGREVGAQIMNRLEAPPRAVLAYATVYHDHAAFLQGLRASIGPTPTMVGCSVQGLMSSGQLLEGAYVSGAMALGGEAVTASCAFAPEISQDPHAKGRELGRDLLRGGVAQPRLVVIHFDPLAKADIDAVLAGLREVVDCPIIGGGSSQNWGPMVATFQFYDDRIFAKGAVALALGGDFTVITQASRGTIPLGITRTVTKCDGIKILELDGRRAMDVWVELTGDGDPTQDHTSDLALGVRLEGEESEDPYRVLGPFGVSEEDGGVLLLAALPEGTELVFHHRTEQTVLEGAQRMALRARDALGDRKLRAVLGFECGARTGPFLGEAAALEENNRLQQTIGPDAEWLGMLAWGEVLPLKRGPALFNYSYPIVCLAD